VFDYFSSNYGQRMSKCRSASETGLLECERHEKHIMPEQSRLLLYHNMYYLP